MVKLVNRLRQTTRRALLSRILLTLSAMPLLICAPALAQPSAAAIAAYDNYVKNVESQLPRASSSDPRRAERLHHGQILLDCLSPDSASQPAGALIHHWRGAAFVPGATAARFQRLLGDFESYPGVFSPQVSRARVLGRNSGATELELRLVQKHVLTVVLDTTYEVRAGPGWSIARSTSIREIDRAGTPQEHALPPSQDHGFLWRLNTYWTYREADGGLYLQIETVSLTRSIPSGLGWAVRPFVESVPRESLQFTLNRVCTTLRGAR